MFPVQDTVKKTQTPAVTVGLIAVCVLVFFWQLNLHHRAAEAVAYLYGFVPARFTHTRWAQWVGLSPDNFLPFLSHMFLHGNFVHIFSNMWVLWMYGSAAEEKMRGCVF